MKPIRKPRTDGDIYREAAGSYLIGKGCAVPTCAYSCCAIASALGRSDDDQPDWLRLKGRLNDYYGDAEWFSQRGRTKERTQQRVMALCFLAAIADSETTDIMEKP